jgi:phytoene synthase
LAIAARDQLDETVRRADPDRWLTSRFVADPEARHDLIILYAFDAELARARRVASSAPMAQIRLMWWSEALEEISSGSRPRSHPVALALADRVRRRQIPLGPLRAMIEGRIEAAELEPFDITAAERWAEAVGGSAAESGAAILGAGVNSAAARTAGRTFALSGLVRSGRLSIESARPTLIETLSTANRSLQGLPAAAFPAVAAATLARACLSGREPSQFGRRARLLWAVARGRI